jgi:hypothetical protein
VGPATLPTAINEARCAIDLAPEWHVVHGCLALAVSSAYADTDNQHVALEEEARAHAARARSLAGHDHNVLWTVAWAQSNVGPVEDALANGARAVEANPNSANARNAYAQALIAAGLRKRPCFSWMRPIGSPREGSPITSPSPIAAWPWSCRAARTKRWRLLIALKLNPAHIGTLSTKLILLAKLHRMPEAAATL